MTEKLVFASLEYEVQRAICAQMVERECDRLRLLGINVQLGADALEILVREGYHRGLGARPMRSAVERYIQERVTTQLLA
jgi:ATP-dependent Clp protease ATP-binding subunit ClpB